MMAHEEVELTKTMADQDAIMGMATEEEEQVVDWLELPHHVLELIINKLMTPEISDYVRCGAVCTSWRTVFIDHHHHPPARSRPVTLAPFLIVPTPSSSISCSSNKNKKNKKKVKTLSFYNIIDKNVVYSKFQVTIPRTRYFRGSSHGWLFAVDQNDNNCQVLLFNPFLSPSVPLGVSAACSSFPRGRGEILLPSLMDISVVINKTIDVTENDGYECNPCSYVYFRKAVLSADPLSNPIDYIVMAILGSPGRLAYCRPGCHDSQGWNLVEFEYNKEWGFTDVIYHKGKFYALSHPGKVVVMDPPRNMVAVTLEIPRPQTPLSLCDTLYLVESAGNLFQVYREMTFANEFDIGTKTAPYSTAGFKVFMLTNKNGKICDMDKMNNHHNYYQEQKEEDGECGGRQWKLLEDLGGSTLFLGDNHSISVRASDYPGLQPNSIYFTDDYITMYHGRKWIGPHDLGVFNLVDGTIKNHYPTDHTTPIWPVPIWIKPTVQAISK